MKKGSSFYWPMRLAAGKEERAALFALHGFLQAVDDAADGADAGEGALARWQRECVLLRGGEASTAEGKALLPFIHRFGLDVAWLEAVVGGCMMDVSGGMRMPSEEELTLYCERVAVMPGVLVLAILGHRGEAAEALAQALGQALQRTNMLRDAGEDAAIGRVYFPPQAREEFIVATEAYYQQAAQALARLPAQNLLPVVLMRDVYWRVFCRVRNGQSSGSHQVGWFWLLRHIMRFWLRGA